MSKTLAVSSLTPYINASVNRDQTGEAKKCVIGNVVRGRISSQCLKFHWRNSEAFANLDKSAGSKHYRTREAFNILVADELKKANLPNAELIPEYTAIAISVINSGAKATSDDASVSDETVATTEETTSSAEETTVVETAKSAKSSSKKSSSKKSSSKTAEIDLSSKQLISISTKEIDVIKATISKALETKDVSVIKKLDLKSLSYELPPSIALAGKFNTAKALSVVDGSLSVAHSFSIHANVSDSDYYIATDDLAKYEGREESGAAYLDSSNITSNVYYGFLNIDLDKYCQNRFRQDLAATCQNPSQKALVVSELSAFLEIVFQVNPEGKHTSTAPLTKASFGLLEISNSPQTNDQAFLTPVKNDSSLWSNAYNRLINFIRDTDEIYDNKKGLSRGYFGLHMNADQRQAFEQDLGCSKVGISSLSTWLEAAIDKINAI